MDGARGPAATGPATQDDTSADAHITADDGKVHERDPRKLQADYAAHLALKGGFTLHELAAGGFLVCRWDRHHHCADLAGVRAFLARLGVEL